MRGPGAGVMPSRIGVCGAELSGLVPWEECLLLGVHLSGRIWGRDTLGQH